MTEFESRAAGADAAIWTALTHQVGKMATADDAAAVMAGAVTALTRFVYHTLAEPSVTGAVEAIREMSCKAALAVEAKAKEDKR